MILSLFGVLFGLACGGGSSSGGVTSPGGGCEVVGLYCLDFVGTSWDAAAAEERCDLISDDLVSGGWVPAIYDPLGCPGGATAECTGYDGIPGDPESEIIWYYYADPPTSFMESGCTDGGGTFTLY
jgi:hypothetical protein